MRGEIRRGVMEDREREKEKENGRKIKPGTLGAGLYVLIQSAIY